MVENQDRPAAPAVTDRVDLFRRAMTWLGRHEFSTMLAGILIIAGIWGFVEIADEVMEGSTESIDRAILMSLRTAGDPTDPLGPKWVEELGRDFTALGGIGVLTLITIAVSAYLFLQRKTRAAVVVLAAVGGGFAVSMLLKAFFSRPRPDLVPHGSYVYTASFPSGHAMLSATVYLTLGALLARVHPSRRMKAFFLILSAVIALAVGCSRVYLGVHWPTDVLAGWTLGACWATLCWLIAFGLQRQGAIEKDQTHLVPDDADGTMTIQ